MPRPGQSPVLRDILRARRAGALALLLVGCGAPAAPPGATATAAAAPAGRIVLLAETGPQSAIVSLRPDGQARAELLRGAGLYPAPVAPNGDTLAVIAVEETGGSHLERLQLLPLTDVGVGPAAWTSPPASHVRNPSWAPDGSFLVFEASLDGFREIYRVDLPAGKLRRLTDNPEGNFEPAVSPDGSKIAFVSSRDLNAEVYLMTADGGAQTRLTAFHLDDWGPQWAQGGDTLVFISNREQMDRIFLMRPDGADQRRLTDDPTPPDNGRLGDEPHEADPMVSPDGGTLAFCVRTGVTGASLRLADLRTREVRRLTDGQHSDRAPTWSPDGAHLVFVTDRDAGDLELYRIAAAGDDLTRLTDRPGADWLPRWSR
jgi:TolB protein